MSTFWIIAEPNGAGKTTFSLALQQGFIDGHRKLRSSHVLGARVQDQQG